MKKIAISLCALAAVAVGIFIFYNSTKSELEINIGAPVDAGTDRYSESLAIAHGTKEYSDEVYAQTNEIIETFGEYRVALAPKLNAPYHIEIEVAFEEGKTIIRDIGTYADENGILQDYEHELIFDFIVTEKVTYPK